MLSKKAIDDYKKIYKDTYGKNLSDKEALEKATKFLNLFKTIYKPISI